MALSWTSFATFYLLLKQTSIPHSLLKYLKLHKRIPASMATLAATLIFYKLSLPIRIKGAIALTPRIIDYFGI